ncbi:MAG: hypothetical protein AAF348_19415, partial [Bacteroidota bacterium]
MDPLVRANPDIAQLNSASGGGFLSQYFGGFGRGFADQFSGFKTLFTNPGALLEVPTLEEAFTSSLQNNVLLRPYISGARTMMAAILGNVDEMGYISGSDWGSATIDGLSAIPGAGWFKGLGRGFFRTAKGARVFWSGGDVAKNSAMNFAKSNGMKTLEMTTSGRIMNTVSPYLPRSVSSPIWDRLSR